jgi:MFS family permease
VNHSLIATLKNLRGNPRGCVYTEPLWGIPFNLYSPYTSIFMIALGLTDKQIGSIISISWGFQLVLAIFSGVITDKLGRRLTTLIFDILSWSVPAVISAIAQNYWYFLAAAIINSVWRITHTSWSCLLVEDADPDQLVDIYSWIYIANIFVGFIAPVAGVLIGTFSLIPTVRGLYVLAAIMFAAKAIFTYRMTTETQQGMVRMRETQHQSIFIALSEYRGIIPAILRAPQTLYTAGIMLISSITNVITGNFWGIIVTEKLHIPNEHLAIFPFIKSAVMLFFFFVIMPRLNKMHFKLPMSIGFLGFVLSQALLVTAPEKSYLFLVFSVILEACAFAAVSPLVDKMVVLTIDAQERARIQSIVYVGIILITSPFGWIAGTLSELDKNLPFILNISLFAIGALIAYFAGNYAQKTVAIEAATPS